MNATTALPAQITAFAAAVRAALGDLPADEVEELTDGLEADLAGVEVGNNTAKKNGGYGIYAPGAVDLGGNIASGNALGDCVGVSCTRR